MKAVQENRMGTVQKIGTGAKATVVKLTPAATRAILTFPAKDRDKILLAAEKQREKVGHPTKAGATCLKVWDHHIALADGIGNSPEAIAEWRKERDLKRPAVA